MSALARNRDFIFSLILLGLNILVSWQILEFPGTNEKLRALGPDVFPWIINAALYALGVILLCKSLANRKEAKPFPTYTLKAWLNMGLIMAFCLLIIPAVQYANFLTWGILMMGTIQYALGERRILVNALYSFAFPVLIYAIFAYGLNVALP